jgi:hypothetical protein
MRRMRIIIAGSMVLTCAMAFLLSQNLDLMAWWETSPDVKPTGIKPEDLPPSTTTLCPGELAAADPVGFLVKCLHEYHERVTTGYTCTFVMHERVNGKLKDPEQIECWYRENPYSIMMHWQKGAGLAAASLYVADENEGKLCVRLDSLLGKRLGWVKSAPDGPEAKSSSRYRITEFGVRCGTERTYRAWKALQERGVKLQVQYLGVQQRDEIGGRACHVVKRTCDPPEEEGLTDVTIYVDVETWLQVGSVLMNNGELIGSYWFKDIRLNPTFDDKQFKPETLKKY